MEENKNNKKIKLRNCLIGFFVVMLFLTIFSSTLANLTLPQVTVTKIKSGTIYTKVRGSGKVEAVHNYDLKAEGKRKIRQVSIAEGDSVSENQLLFTYEDRENETLMGQEENLERLMLEYQKALLDVGNEYGTSNILIQNARDELLLAIEKRNQAEALQGSKTALEESIAGKTEALSKLEEKVSAAQKKQDKNGDIVEVLEIENTITALEREIAALQVETADLNEDSKKAEADGDTEKVAALNRNIRDKETELTYKKKDLSKANDNLIKGMASNKAAETYKKALEEAMESYNKKKTELDNEKEKLTLLESDYQSKEEAEAIVKEKEAALKALVLEEKKQSLDFNDLTKRLKEQKETIEKIKKTNNSNQLLSPVNGIISEVNFVAGDSVEEGDTLLTINMIEQGYTLSFPVTVKQSEYVRIGDKGEILNLFDKTAKAELTGIKVNPEDPNKSKILTFQLEGDAVEVSQSLAVSVGSLCESYETIIPINSLFEDNQGKFVYILKVKATPLGNRYSVVRKAVEVVAADDSYVAVLSDISVSDYVITESVEPLQNGIKVRMSD